MLLPASTWPEGSQPAGVGGDFFLKGGVGKRSCLPMTTKLTAFLAFDRWNSVATSKFLFFDFGESSMVTFSMPLVTLLIETAPFCLCCVPPLCFRPRFYI